MRQAKGPSTGREIGVSVVLLVLDLMVIAWMVYGYGMAGWADSYESDSANATRASEVASQASWILGGGAVLTGGGLLALGWRIPGVVQLVVLGVGAVQFSSVAAGGQHAP
ncbi:DUF6234 family protein [Streptomyces djakartensis]|uniref:Integral membrane protein n=1 Tax=Streptomyces djakartensis TaxID=68193 RepID=A0ABQ2ZQH8_9ACTN|nr:DUF6234 family protein [Streptomyces djakartensis]GGY20286.1 hypothetical protein GCM10010384_28530 [Streptomyces djakartensis]